MVRIHASSDIRGRDRAVNKFERRKYWHCLILFVNMLRRKPTRIQLKLDDLDEWNTIKKERAEKTDNAHGTPQPGTSTTPMDAQTNMQLKREMMQERIGYNPKPMSQPHKLPIH